MLIAYVDAGLHTNTKMGLSVQSTEYVEGIQTSFWAFIRHILLSILKNHIAIISPATPSHLLYKSMQCNCKVKIF